MLLRAGAPEGYGSRAWPLRVGGAGLGDDPALAAAMGTPPRAPLAVRFGVPVAGFCMAGVDDAGFVDASFWRGPFLFYAIGPTTLFRCACVCRVQTTNSIAAS